MKKSFLRRTMIAFILGVSVLFCIAQYAENIDPHDDNSQYAYGENIGWLNFEPSEGPGVTVTDTGVTGFVWAENIGWVNLTPTTYGGVTNDGSGNLGGYAWGENVGWINFNPTYGGVTIDNEGNFDGWAWGENIGWIHFQNLSVPYKVQTAWSAEVSVQNTLTISAGTGGTTDPAPGTHNYDEGTDVPITATPDTNHRFSGWTGDVPSGHENDNPITITMDSDKSVTASFTKEEEEKKDPCFIATATYGSPFHPHVKILRDFRDKYLMPDKLGRVLVNLYYKYSPFVADLIAKHKILKIAVRFGLLPVIAFSYSMVNIGPIITVVLPVFIFVLPIFLISFFRRKLSQVEAKDLKLLLPET